MPAVQRTGRQCAAGVRPSVPWKRSPNSPGSASASHTLCCACTPPVLILPCAILSSGHVHTYYRCIRCILYSVLYPPPPDGGAYAEAVRFSHMWDARCSVPGFRPRYMLMQCPHQPLSTCLTRHTTRMPGVRRLMSRIPLRAQVPPRKWRSATPSLSSAPLDGGWLTHTLATNDDRQAKTYPQLPAADRSCGKPASGHASCRSPGAAAMFHSWNNRRGC